MKKYTINAPEINTKFGWVNTEKSYTLSDFKGKIVLLDFWTFGCINCQHIVPDLERLEKEYANELVVIGVHSAKFSSEKGKEAIQNAILKFGINHPVVNDADFKVWQAYGVRAWPTVTLITPDGKIAGQRSGEGVYDAIKPYIDTLIQSYDKEINRTPISFNLKKTKNTTLRFPSKMIVEDSGNLWISDSGNHRIIQMDSTGKIVQIIGKGTKGAQDGNFKEATFYEPHGLALRGNNLYIADTKNNLIRKANLADQTVKTIAGDGSLGQYYFDQEWDQPVNPNSPWDLLIHNDIMYIANAGNHQILKMKLNDGDVMRYAGSGREALLDGNLREAAFNQPSGLDIHKNILYVADAEASAIRAIDLNEKTVKTLLGTGLFDFGDRDGQAKQALLQHAVGLYYFKEGLIIADTYNGKIKYFDFKTRSVKTWVEGLNEPNDITIFNNALWISDTNNHQIIRVDLQTLKKEVVRIIE